MINIPTILLRLLVALTLGSFIGWEREYHEHNAGIKTNALVCLGTALFTLISAYGFLEFTSYMHFQIDPTRIASYIVAGIGFLGGGVITHRNNGPARGLTTAASIWVVAAIGMACGIGLLVEACTTTVITLGILIGLHYVENALLPRHPKQIEEIVLQIIETMGEEILQQVQDILGKNHIQLTKISISSHDRQKELTITVHEGNTHKIMPAFSALQQLPGVQSAQISFRIDEY